MINLTTRQRLGALIIQPNKWLLVLSAVLAVAMAGCEQKSEADHLQRAQEYVTQGDFQAGIIEYKSALQLNPENIESRFALGKLHLEVGDGAAAEKELSKVLDRSAPGDQGRVLPLLANALLLQGKYQAVLDDIAVSEEWDATTRAAVLAARGDAHLGLNHVDVATQHYRQALALDAGQLRAILGQAKLDLLNGGVAAAREKLDQVLAVDPTYGEALIVLGQVNHNHRDFAAAEQAYTRLIDAKPKNVITPIILQARLGRIQAMLAQSNMEGAAKETKFLTNRLPEHPLPRYYQGLIHFQQGNNDAAEQNLTKVLKVLPSHQPSLLLLGSINYAQGELALADEYLSQFVAAAPTHAQARKLLAATRMKLHQPELALQAIGPLLEGSDGDTQAWALAGSAALRTGDVAVGTEYLQKALAADPDNASVRTELAVAYLAESDMDKALQELQAAAQGEGEEQTRAGILLALAQLRNKDSAAALQTVQGMIDKSPEDVTLHNLQGIIYDQQGNSDEARRKFEHALRLNEAYTPAVVNLARLDQRAGRIGDAQARYEQVLAKDPDNVSVMLALAQMADQSGDTEQARRWLSAAVDTDQNAVSARLLLARYELREGNGQAALRLLKQTVIDVPDSVQARFDLGLMQAAQGLHQDALTTFDGLLALDSKHADAHLQKGLAHIRLKAPKEAKAALKNALEIKPDHIQAASLLARLAVSEGDANAATQVVTQFKAASDDAFAGHVLEGDVAMMQKNHAAAIAAYRVAVRLQASEPAVTRLFGAYSAAGRSDDAQQTLKQWLANNPDNYTVRMRLAGSYLENGRRAEAIEQYAMVVEQRPEDAMALNNLAWLYQELGDARALSLAERAYAVRPDDPGVADTLGWILVQQGENQRGLAMLTEAAEKAPEVADIRYHLAVALTKAGEHDKARDILVDLMNDSTGLSVGEADIQALLNQL